MLKKMLILTLALPCLIVAEETRLLRNPAISADHVVFEYAHDIWVAKHGETDARRLTSFPGIESLPHFSPDGKWIAFSGQYGGNIDVYIVSVNGGEPQRLTWHPGPEFVRGWNPKTGEVLFLSARDNAPIGIPRFWTISTKGGMPSPLPLPRAYDGEYNAGASKLVYQMVWPWDSEWRNYRGGQNNPVRIIDLKSLAVEKLPWDGANDKNPVWVGDEIFFLSDRDFAMNVWSYSLKTKALTQRTFFKEFDCKQLDAGAGKLIFENGGYLHVMDAAGGEPEKLSLTVRGDFPWALPHWEDVAENIRNGALSPTGKRIVFEARGDIFTVPAKKGDIRNLTKSSGVADRSPAWSPDGKSISWFSDAGGEYHLVISDQFGNNKRKLQLPDPEFYYTPEWSPDSKFISYGDADRNIWILDVASGKTTQIDNEGSAHPFRTIYPEWAPDSKWLAYTKRLENQYNAIHIYSVNQKKSWQLTDGMSDCVQPAWDKDGKYIYFLSSTNYGLNVGWLDMSSLERPRRYGIYLAVLANDTPSPLLPESDDEPVEDEKKSEEEKKDKDKKDKKEESVAVKVDMANIGQRIISLGLPARNYGTLEAGGAGTLFYTEFVPNSQGATLHRYKLEDRKSKKLLDGVTRFWVSHDGKKLAYGMRGGKYAITDAGGSPKPGDGTINTAGMKMHVNPAAEWAQMFREAWRYQRDFFYVSNVHGLDLDWAYRTYSPWLKHVRHRRDLNYLLDILGGETAVGHSFVGGGDNPDVENVPGGLLGADFEIDSGRYRISKIYTGENWNPQLRSPLSGPGIDAKTGDYLLAVNGRQLTADMNPYSLFDQTAGKQTVLTLSSTADKSAARDITVVPVSSEGALRRFDWVEGNRRKVDELSGGKLAYVWLPNTGFGGYNYFNRYYFAQKHKQGAVIDERFNGGGLIADYIVDLMSRELMGFFNNPVGDKQPWTAPNAALFGPKVMLVNEMAGSGGDMLPFMFKLRGIGPLVGTKTWGGLVGIWDVPSLIDGGNITAPRGGFYNLDGEWDVENEGIAPDYVVDESPELYMQGRDSQLEKAVEVAMELLKTSKVKMLPQPKDPVRVKRPEGFTKK